MSRVVFALLVQTALVLLLALLVLGAWLRLTAQEPSVVTGEAPRLLFFFMDIGLAVWAIILLALTLRRRALPGVGATLVAAIVGVVLNALTVFVVGTVQGRSYLTYAIEAGVAFLLAVLVSAPIIHRLFRVKPPRESAPPA